MQHAKIYEKMSKKLSAVDVMLTLPSDLDFVLISKGISKFQD